MKRQILKTSIMMKHGGTHGQFNAILLIGITFITTILTLEDNHFPDQRYDYIDVQKEAPKGRIKGQTTRIFTTHDGLDEKFWLKYLGEDIRNAVHLQVDDNNNVLPMEDREEQHPTNRMEIEKPARYVRQPAKDYNEQEPVENYEKQYNNQYPTEKPEKFNVNLTGTTPVYLPQSLNTKRKHYRPQPDINSKKLWKHKFKLPIANNYKEKIIKMKQPRKPNAIRKPIVVNLPEIDSSEHQIDNEHVPIVVHIPPIIYHQKAEVYSEKLRE